MYRLEEILSTLDHALGTKRKRHVVGGILMSIAMLFGSLAITAITLKGKDDHLVKQLQ